MFLNFSSDAKKVFTERGLQARKIILSALGSNPPLKDKKLEIDKQNSLLPVQLVSSKAKTTTNAFEPLKMGINKEKSGALGSANHTRLPIQIPFKLLKLFYRI